MKINKEILKGLFWGIVACALISMCTGCTTTRYINIPEFHEVVKVKTDSVLIRDTLYELNQVFIHEADSQAIAEFGIRLRENEKAFLIEKSKLQKQIQSAREVKTDTFVRRDSIPYPVVQEVVTTKTDYRGWFVALALMVPLILLIRKHFNNFFSH